MRSFIVFVAACFLVCGLFLSVQPASAAPVQLIGATAIGGIVNEEVWVGDSFLGYSQEDYFDHPEHLDSPFNVNVMLDLYSSTPNNPDNDLVELHKNEKSLYGKGEEWYGLTEGTITFSEGTEYISLKFAGPNGGWYLWDVSGIDIVDGYGAIDFDGLPFGLSHYTEWGLQVPLPTAALLLGSGLIGLVGFRRKNK